MDDNSSSSSSSIVGHSSSYIANEHNKVGRPNPSLGFDSYLSRRVFTKHSAWKLT